MSTLPSISRQPIGRKFRILVADDQVLIRNVVRSILEENARFDVCGEATNGAIAVAEAQRLKPDVVILNISMPVLGGMAAAREIKSKMPHCAIIILSSHADQRFIEEAKKIGVRAYVAKANAAGALVKAIDLAVLGGDFVVVD